MYLVTRIQNKLHSRKVDTSENIHTKERNKKNRLNSLCLEFCFRVFPSLFHRNIFLRQIADNSKIRNSRIRLPQISTKTQYLLNDTICIYTVLYIECAFLMRKR